jgi:hypothetical protein
MTFHQDPEKNAIPKYDYNPINSLGEKQNHEKQSSRGRRHHSVIFEEIPIIITGST